MALPEASVCGVECIDVKAGAGHLVSANSASDSCHAWAIVHLKFINIYARAVLKSSSSGLFCQSDASTCLHRGAISQEQATQLYTGSHWKVEASVLSEVEHFSRFAARALPPALSIPLHILSLVASIHQTCQSFR